MPIVVSFSNQKGGVGKTTYCLHYAFHLAVKKRKKVLVIDFDSQGNVTSRVLPHEGDLIYPEGKTRVIDLFDPKLKKIEPAKGLHDIDVIYTINNDVELAEIESAALERALAPAENLRKFLAANHYDYVLVDCPPTLGRRLVAALAFTHHVVVPIKVSGFAVEGVEGLMETVVEIRESVNPDLNVTAFIINDMDPKSVIQKRSLEELKDTVGELLLSNHIQHRSPIDTATSLGVPVWSLGYAHAAAKELSKMFDELTKRIEK